MNLDRRDFILGAGIVAAMPVLISVGVVADSVPENTTDSVLGARPLTLMIDGWSVDDEVSTDKAWLVLDRAWKVAWR